MFRRTEHHRRATTIAELIIAITVTALISLGVAAILQAATYGTSARREVRRVAVRSEQVRSRIDNALCSARAVLASGSGYIVLWIGDTRKNDQVNLSELQLLEIPSGSTTLSSYTTVFPTGWTQTQIDTADVAYAAGSNFATVAQTAKAGSYFPGTVWATGASSFTVALDNASLGLTHLVTWDLTLTNDLLSDSLVGAASLREIGVPQ